MGARHVQGLVVGVVRHVHDGVDALEGWEDGVEVRDGGLRVLDLALGLEPEPGTRQPGPTQVPRW